MDPILRYVTIAAIATIIAMIAVALQIPSLAITFIVLEIVAIILMFSTMVLTLLNGGICAPERDPLEFIWNRFRK